MPDRAVEMIEHVGGFPIQNMMMRYNLFIPRLFNWCMSLGFEPGKIMPSRAFCSDESQGYPIIMIAKHFGTFPFNHGRVGGIVATGRHGPHAGHGKDVVIIQASHVGYDPQTQQFGIYRRLQTAEQSCGPSCGKVHSVLDWYQNEYHFAQHNILLHNYQGQNCISIDNQLILDDREEGLFLYLKKIIETDENGEFVPLKILSTSKVFLVKDSFANKVGTSLFSQTMPQQITGHLDEHMFYFRRIIPENEEGAHDLDHNLIRYMPQIVTSPWPILLAAQINTQIEFDRTFRTIVKERGYHNKKVLFIAGLNIDISPQPGQFFPLTKFVPWAAFTQDRDGSYATLEQADLMQLLEQQELDNPHQINLETAIQSMSESEEIKIDL